MNVRLDAARKALEGGRPRRALRLAWAAAARSASGNDREGLEEVIDLAETIRDRSQGRAREEASTLAAYSAYARDNPQPPRLFGLLRGRYDDRTRPGTPEPGKVCPSCAETVRPEARICRFCGHRFVPGS
jgi:hypothetical protein